MKRLLVFLIIVLLVAGFASACTPAPSETPAPDPSFYLDSDGDGMNDWFEENIAKYDPNIPNDRYIILYSRYDDPVNFPEMADIETNNAHRFFTERGKVPSENIIILKREGATTESMRDAVDQVAKKSDENDIVFLSLNGHGGGGSITGSLRYTKLDEWLDKVKAKVVIVKIMACGCEEALPILKDGPCPRIVFVQSAGEFIGMLGADPGYAFAADTKYGNSDDYVSLKEIGDLLNYDPFWGNDWGRLYYTYDELYTKGRSFVEAEGYSKVSDTSNVASKSYLTDYYYKTDFKPDPLERQAYSWIYYKP